MWNVSTTFSAIRRPSARSFWVVGGTQLLGALPCDEHLVVRGVGLDRCREPGPLLLGEVLGAGAEDGLDPVERIALPAAVTEGVLLDTSTDLVDGGGAELDDVERVQHGRGVFELVGLFTNEGVVGV